VTSQQMPRPAEGTGAGGAPLPPAPVTRAARLQINPQALRVVPENYRRAWTELGRSVAFDVASRFRQKWTTTETLQVILADPSQTYAEVAEELGRSPGGVRYRRQAMIHLLRDEHGAKERAQAYRDHPRANHKHHDYFQVDEVLTEYGFYAMTVAEQFAIAKPLQQPSSGWRGDGTGSALAGDIQNLKEAFKQLLRDARSEAQQQDGVVGAHHQAGGTDG
jgi:hypothetical protein